MLIKAKIQKIIFILIFSIFFACNGDDDQDNSCIPRPTINVAINLSLASYQNLNFSGGWIYYNDDLAGSRGLIVVNTGNGFKAYDRNAPHICPTNNSTLVVENNTIIVCPQDDAQWILTTGQPLQVANQAPIQYFTSFSNGIVYVAN